MSHLTHLWPIKKEQNMTTFIEATISGAGYTLGVTFTLLTIILLIMVINYDR